MTGAPILLLLLAVVATVAAILSGPTHDQCGPRSGGVPGDDDG